MISNCINIFLKYKKNIMIFVLAILVVTLSIHIIILNNANIQQQVNIDMLNKTISNQTKEKQDMENQIAELQSENNKLKEQAKKDKAEIKKYKEKETQRNNTYNKTNTTKTDNTTSKSFGVFKSYTDYKCLARNSSQWKLQEQAYTDGNGLRKIGDAYLVAMGSYYGTTLGTRYTVKLSNGNTFQVMLCDFKKNAHTDSNNQATISDGSVLEFYVDGNKLNQNAKRMGSIGAIPFFSGSIVSITKN